MPHDIIRSEFTLPPMLIEAFGDTNSWYSTEVSWLFANVLDINNLPPLRYNHETDQTLIFHMDRTKVICQEIWQIYTPPK